MSGKGVSGLVGGVEAVVGAESDSSSDRELVDADWGKRSGALYESIFVV